MQAQVQTLQTLMERTLETLKQPRMDAPKPQNAMDGSGM